MATKASSAWNTVGEIADYLGKQTKQRWIPADVLRLAVSEHAARTGLYARGPQNVRATLLSAPLPIGVRIERVVVSGGRSTVQGFRHAPPHPLSMPTSNGRAFAVVNPDQRRSRDPVPRIAAPLFAENVAALIDREETLVEFADANRDYSIKPPVVITLAMVGAKAESVEKLKSFAHAHIALAEPQTPVPEQPTHTASRREELVEEDIASLFNPVSVEELETIFPANGRWKAWAERAANNGLSVARDGRARFNPYVAGVWFLKKGEPNWSHARLHRVLANNLPLRSADQRDLLMPSAGEK